MTALLEVRDLKTYFATDGGEFRAVDGVSFKPQAGPPRGVVAESGWGQRVMIAMARACEPRLLIADEPTTALDVTIQAQILDLMRALRAETGTAIILITHDLGVIAEIADDVAVMYAGRIVERAPVQALFANPQHPYTIGLLGSIPELNVEQERLAGIEGPGPNPLQAIGGCPFHPRCPFADEQCRRAPPPLRAITAGPPGGPLEGPPRGKGSPLPPPGPPPPPPRLRHHFPPPP